MHLRDLTQVAHLVKTIPFFIKNYIKMLYEGIRYHSSQSATETY